MEKEKIDINREINSYKNLSIISIKNDNSHPVVPTKSIRKVLE